MRLKMTAQLEYFHYTRAMCLSYFMVLKIFILKCFILCVTRTNDVVLRPSKARKKKHLIDGADSCERLKISFISIIFSIAYPSGHKISSN